MSYLPFFSILLLALNFSGKPAPETTVKKTATVISVTPPKEEDAENIPWTESRLLVWDDFQCEPKRNSDAVASTSTSLGLAYQVEDGKLSYSITCTFSKHKSWGLLRTDYILAHEQAHFDITELYARELHKALQQYQFNRKTYRKDVNDIYRQIVKDKEAMQAAYDGGSDHSRQKRAQYDWLEKIDLMLEETKGWAGYP